MYKIDKIQKENQRIHTIGRVVSAILYIILIPIIIVNFTLIIKSFIHPNQTPDFFGYKSFVIVSGSMEPTIKKGDAIIVKEVPEEEIKANDIISFMQGQTNVTHRIIDITIENGVRKYKTKGDNNNSEDKEKITYEQIEGKYQLKINQFGVITNILKSKITLMILILIIIVMYVYKSRMENKRQKRKEKRKNMEDAKNKKDNKNMGEK
ncbi:MAG: signal peptidase I [Clostridia bacterium]|nr:signal peptidase I [Clostridia bacterium]